MNRTRNRLRACFYNGRGGSYDDRVTITVGELVGIRYLGLKLVAGESGASRLVEWAHTCEVPAPWAWLDRGDLLMTNGYSIPLPGGAQVDFIRELDAAGVAGIAIGEDQQAPQLTDEVLRFATEIGFPMISAAYEVPFSAVSRAVASANKREEHARLLHTVRLYDRVRDAVVEGRKGLALLERVADDLRCQVHVLDPERGIEVLSGVDPLPATATAAISAAVVGRDAPLPALTRVPVDGDESLLVLPIHSRRRTVLVVRPHGRPQPTLPLLQHLATIAALEVERLTAEREEERRTGSELLAALLDGDFDPSVAQHQLAHHDLGPGPYVLAVWNGPDDDADRTLHHRLADRGVPHLLLRRSGQVLVLLQDAEDALAALQSELRSGTQLGISEPFRGDARVTDAAREAQWALVAAQNEERAVAHYGDDAPLFLPRTLGEGERLVTRILGPLIDYDIEHHSDLVKSLRTFLSCDRSWVKTASELHVHKQTLVYRMKRVEELTGRRLHDTGDIAELWLALRTLDLGTAEERPPAAGATQLHRPLRVVS